MSLTVTNPLQPVLVHELHRLFPACAITHGDELALGGHDGLDLLVELGFKPQVSVGHDTHDFVALQNGESRDLVLLLKRDHVANRHFGRYGHRVPQDSRFEALDLGDLGRLRLGRQVLVHDADPALLGDRDRQSRLCHRIHCRRYERDVQLERSGEAGLEGNIARQNARVGGKEENVVEGQRHLDDAH
jgi:hypothetical protein